MLMQSSACDAHLLLYAAPLQVDHTFFVQVVRCEFLSEEGDLLNDDPTTTKEGSSLEASALTSSSTPLPSTAPPQPSPPPMHQEEAAADSEGAQRESELPHDTSTTVDLSVLQEAVAESDAVLKVRSNASETVASVSYACVYSLSLLQSIVNRKPQIPQIYILPNRFN